MSDDREMTLDEWVNKLPDFHLANKEYRRLNDEIEAKDKQIAKLADNLIDAACDLSSCPNMEFKEYMKLGREALGEE
jgi:hypothetical protein